MVFFYLLMLVVCILCQPVHFLLIYWFVFCVDLYIICRCYWFVFFCVSLFIFCLCFEWACTLYIDVTGLYFVWACTLSVDVTGLYFVSACSFSVYDTGFIFCVCLYIFCWCYWFIFCVGLYLLGGNLPALVLMQDVDIAASRQTHSGCVGTRYIYDADVWVVQIWHLSQLTLFFRSSRVTLK